jgi:hypothetical protein
MLAAVDDRLTNSERWVVASLVTTIDREVCRFPISAEVIDYSCRTTVKREVLI